MRRHVLALLLLAGPAAGLTPTPVQSVFFDGWHARLDPAARAVLAGIAAEPPRGRWYVVEGFTDASRPVPQDRAMGLARAEAVGAELVRLGLPASLVHLRGYGATGPDGPTGPPGLVLEAANRVAIWTCFADAPACREVVR